MGYTLIIAEKPDAARRIAEALADQKPKVKQNYGVPYYEFTVEGKKHVCAPAVGHLFVLNPVSKSWTYPVFDLRWVPTYLRKETRWTEKYFKNLQELVKNADELIDAADVDTEGEVLLYNILRFICGKENAKRMKFTTLTKDELREAYRNLDKSLLFPLLESGLVRHWLDALWGFNLTRALTLALKNNDNRIFSILSTGRVQGPTLKILLDRELEIRNFVPKPYWQLRLRVRVDGKEIEASYEKERIWEEREALEVLEKCKGKDAVVESIRRRVYSQPPPPPFNTLDLQVEAHNHFKFSPTQTLEIAESLYQQGFISYPRSSSQKIPVRINYEKLIQALAQLKPYQKLAQSLLQKPLKPVEGKKEDPAHYAVIATWEVPELGKLTPQQRKIYDLIARRTLAAFAPPARRETLSIVFNVNGFKFLASGRRILEPGWLSYYTYSAAKEVILPELKEGQLVKVVKLQKLDKQTEPPPRYSQASIIKEMEKRGLGTKATRAEILQTLYQRKYIKGKSIEVTSLGEMVAKVLEEFCPRILSEELTRKFEQEMEKVMQKGKDKEEIIEEAKKVLKEILEEFKTKEESIGKKLAQGLLQVRESERRLGQCPRCKGELMIIKTPNAFFVGCSSYPACTSLYPLPKNARIEKTGKTCEKCSTPIIRVFRKGRRPFSMCLLPTCETKASWNKKSKSS